MQQPAEASNPLEQLRDIHLPEEQVFFELAPLWWIIILLIISVGIYWLIRYFKKRRLVKLIKPAMHELDEIAKLPASPTALGQVSALLKRVCLVYYPKAEVASKTGRDWLVYLNEKSGSLNFSGELFPAFESGIYNPNFPITPSQWDSLLTAARRCIRQIVTNEAEKQL